MISFITSPRETASFPLLNKAVTPPVERVLSRLRQGKNILSKLCSNEGARFIGRLNYNHSQCKSSN
jgi:hypothetical protein